MGSGTFAFDGPATAGTFALPSLANYVFNLTVNGVDFANADLVTPAANILVRFTASGPDLLVNFGGSRGGPFGGSADFLQGPNTLSFQPSFGSLYSSNNVLGTYAGVVAATTVPEPGSLALVAAALLGASAFRRKTAR